MPTTPKFAHIVLQTNQLAAMRQWYCRVLDAHVVHEKGALCFITFDDEHHRIALFHPPFQLPARTPMMVGLAHSAYTFPTLEALAEKYEALKNAGVTQRVPVQHGVTTSLYYRDPDGNAVSCRSTIGLRPMPHHPPRHLAIPQPAARCHTGVIVCRASSMPLRHVPSRALRDRRRTHFSGRSGTGPLLATRRMGARHSFVLPQIGLEMYGRAMLGVQGQIGPIV